MSTYADEYNRMMNEGSDETKAKLTGALKGTLAGALEKLVGGIKFGTKGTLDDIAKKQIKNKFKTKVGQFLGSKLYEVLGENAEEEAENIGGYLIDKVVNNKDVTLEEALTDLGQTVKGTTVTTLMLNLLGLGGNTYNEVRQSVAKDNLINSTNLSDRTKENLRNSNLSDENLLKAINIANEFENQDKNTSKQTIKMPNEAILNQEQQTTLKQDKMSQNQTSTQPLGNDKYSIKMPNSNYKFEKTGNVNEDLLDESMSKVFNNSEDTMKLNKTLKQIMKDKNVSIVFEENITDEHGNVLDGKYENGKIIINPNSTRAFEHIATHELTHAIGTKEMLNMVQKYRESNKEFNTKLETILKNYNKSELTEEALAEVSGQLFGTQEFINNVKNTNPNLFQKIYSEIKYLWHQLRGYKNESQFIDDLYYKWTQAYNSKTELNQTTRNMNIGLKGFENASKNLNLINDTETLERYTQMRDSLETALQMAKDGATGWQILKATNNRWTKNSQNNQIIFNISDQDIDIPKSLQRNTTYKLGDIVKHDELFFLYPRLMDLKVVTTNELDGETTAEVRLGRKLEYSKLLIKNSDINNKEKLKENIIHELQHVVQKIEGTLTTKGYSADNLKKYYNNILEIEAEDQVYRYKNKIEDNFPEVARQKPQHIETKDQLPIVKKQIERYNKKNGYKGVVKQDETNKQKLREVEGKTNLVFDRLRNNIRQNVWLDGKGKGSFYRQETENKETKEGLEESSSFNLQKNKEKQLEIIQKNNPLDESLGNHTWITSVDDIKTFKEALEYDEYEGGSLTPDFKEEDLNKALETGEMTVYSSYPIEQGIFVTPSKMEAQNYAGSGKVYSKKIKLSDVAWIDSLQGQYAKVDDSKYAKQGNTEWEQYLEEKFSSEGTRTTREQIRLPEKNVLQENTSNLKQTTTKKETDTEIAKVLNTPVTRQKPQDRKWAIFKASVFDKGIVFEDLSKKAKNRELEAKWDYTLSSSARAQYAIGNARYDENGNQISKGLTEIIDEVGDKIDDFQNYMYHLLNIDRMTLKDRFGIDNKPVFGKNIGKDYSERAVAEFEKNNPEFKEWAQDVYDYANADKAELVKNGVISQELSDKFAEMYPHYVPIQRADKLGNAINLPLDTRRTGVNTPIKQAKGGSSDLNPLFETLAGRTMQTYRASARNSLGVELKNTLESLNSLNSNVNDAESLDSIMDTMTDEKSTSDLLQASKDGKLPTFTVFENGNKVTFDISEDIYDALKPTSAGLSKTSKILNTIGNARRAVLTEYNPLFAITNTIKDTQDVLMNSQHATKTYLKYPEAYWQILTGGYWKQEYIQNGGAQNTYFKDGEFTKQKQKGWLKQAITFPLDAISTVNGALEMAPRLAEYIVSREMGRSVETSMLDASRVTTNFKAGGDVTKFANRNGATFLNAGVQGAMQTVRNIREANVKGLKGWTVLACKMAVAGAPVFILNHLMWGDDDDYEQLQDYVKDGYYIIGKRNDGTFIRIPKGRTLAVIQKVVSNVDKYINNEGSLNIDEVSKDFWDTLKFGIENVAPNNPIDNNVLSPIFQAITNTSWYGEDIVPKRLQNVPNAEQFDETTDKFSKWLGEKTGVSPMKINYLLDQYGGGVSDILLPLGTPQAENTPLEDKFVTDPVMKSKYPGEFFEKSDEITKSSNSMYATDTDIVKGKYMSYIQSNLSDLYKEKREIQNSIATDEEKKRQLKEVQKQINETAKMALEDVEKPKMTETTALIGNEEFYKNSDGEWERLKDKDKIENVSMKSYSDYKIKKEQATDKKRKEKNNDKATLNDAEMITIIKESNYTDKEKDALFDDQINDKTYKHLKLLNNNDITKINQYMDYKTADLEANRVYDGTKKGKAVSGSAKNKLTTYLNNSSFNGVERLYLYGQNYKLNSTQRAQLKNYIKKLDLTPQEEKELWLDLSSNNVVEMADGSIRWK